MRFERGREPLGTTLVRAAGAGASATAAYGVVDIWFSELLGWVLHRDSYAPLDTAFAVVLFAACVAFGALVAAAVASVAWISRISLPPRELGTALLVLVHAAFLRGRLGGSFLALVGTETAVLLGLAIAAMASPEVRERLWFLTSPWTAALLLVAPEWVAGDPLAEAARPMRGAGFAAAAALVVAVAWLVSRRWPGARTSRAATLAAAVVTLAAGHFADPPAPVQLAPVAGMKPLPGAPNVLLVVLDTVRADRMSLYGNPHDTSPALRRFGEGATVYTRAIAPSNMTLATHASLFTGLYASQHGAHYDSDRPAGRPLGQGPPTLAEVFAQRGYDVSSVAGNYGFLGKGFGLDRGFQYLDARPRRRSSLGLIPAHSLRGRLRRAICRSLDGIWPLNDTRARPADEITDLALQRIDRARRSARPYFLFVNYFDAHERVLVPPPFDGRFTPKRTRFLGERFDSLHKTMEREGRVAVPAGERDVLLARYDEALAYLDASLDRLLRHVREGDAEENTLVVVTSDHGEAYGEHGTMGHGSSVYQEQVRVPLVVKRPRQREGDVVQAPVSLVDVFPLVTSGGAAPLRGSAALTESFPLVPSAGKPYVRTGRAHFRSPYKLIRSSRDGTVELYDIEADPEELRDLSRSPERAATLSDMTRELDGWIAAHPAPAVTDAREDREARARLRALGYLQ